MFAKVYTEEVSNVISNIGNFSNSKDEQRFGVSKFLTVFIESFKAL